MITLVTIKIINPITIDFVIDGSHGMYSNPMFEAKQPPDGVLLINFTFIAMST